MDLTDKGEGLSDTDLPTPESELETDNCAHLLPYALQYKQLGTPVPDVKDLGLKIANFLENLVQVNEGIPSCETIFDMKAQPKISLEKYIQRMIDYSQNSAESWVLALVLLQRYIDKKRDMVVHRLNLYK
jgi:hypothetical protein